MLASRKATSWLGAASGLVLITLSIGCLHGGRLASNSLQGRQVLAAYDCEGRPDSRAEYYLIQTEAGLALLERVPGGMGSLIKHHWREGDSDHFAIWGEVLDSRVPAFEWVLPLDRSKKGTAFIYPEGTYSILTIDGRRRPSTALANPRPAFWLVPKGALAQPP